jgi:hypothetical protein
MIRQHCHGKRSGECLKGYYESAKDIYARVASEFTRLIRFMQLQQSYKTRDFLVYETTCEFLIFIGR